MRFCVGGHDVVGLNINLLLNRSTHLSYGLLFQVRIHLLLLIPESVVSSRYYWRRVLRGLLGCFQILLLFLEDLIDLLLALQWRWAGDWLLNGLSLDWWLLRIAGRGLRPFEFLRSLSISFCASPESVHEWRADVLSHFSHDSSLPSDDFPFHFLFI